jgi:hypothetical protein
MMNTVKINARCLQLVKDIVKAAKGRTHFTRTELRAFHKQLRNRSGAPYFICKNEQARPSIRDQKTLGKNVFVVDRFLKYAEKHPPAPMPEPKAKKEAKPKREAVAKKPAAKAKTAKAARAAK